MYRLSPLTDDWKSWFTRRNNNMHGCRFRPQTYFYSAAESELRTEARWALRRDTVTEHPAARYWPPPPPPQHTRCMHFYLNNMEKYRQNHHSCMCVLLSLSINSQPPNLSLQGQLSLCLPKPGSHSATPAPPPPSHTLALAHELDSVICLVYVWLSVIHQLSGQWKRLLTLWANTLALLSQQHLPGPDW